MSNAAAAAGAQHSQRVRSVFTRHKRVARLDDLFTRSIPLGDLGYLLPVSDLHADDDRLIELLATWRVQNMWAYPTQFPVTIVGTELWLKSQVIDAEDRIQFLVLEKHGYPVGHCGFTKALSDDRSLRVDNVMRGVNDAAPGIMSAAVKSLINWARREIEPAVIYLVVFDDNKHAIAFYEKLGFRYESELPLRKYVNGDRVWFAPLEPGDSAPPDKSHWRIVWDARLVDWAE